MTARGGVAAAHRLAAAAGTELLAAGGNAADAAVAAAAAMAVTSPNACGLGGDLFALVHVPGQPVPLALNASGRAGSGADTAADALRTAGHDRVPFIDDVRAVTVPGCVDGLAALARRCGRLGLAAALAPAIRLARDGFPVSRTLGPASHGLTPQVRTTAFGGPEPLASGAPLRLPRIAAVLTAVADRGRDAFYAGPVAAELIALGEGLFTAEDLRAAHAEWVAPLALDAFGHTLHTIPPNSQGYLALAGAWLADAVGLPADPADPDWAATLVEAARQAAHDRVDVLHEHADGEALLDPARLRPRADAIRDALAAGTRSATADVHADGDTTYLCAVDADGAGVSLILSNGAGFGCRLALPESGIFLHNRGIGFSLRDGHPARLTAGHRPPHTLSPVLVTRSDGTLRSVLGTMGGDAQPQIVLQLLARTLGHGEGAQAAIDAPRWALTRTPTNGFDTWDVSDPPRVGLERGVPAAWAPALRGRGYTVDDDGSAEFGHAQLIQCPADGGAPDGAADPRSGDGAFLTV